MVATFGKLEEFDTATGEDWVQYIERMQYYFQANKISAEEMEACKILISTVGAKAYKVMRNLISPANPSDKSFQLVEIMRKDFLSSSFSNSTMLQVNSRLQQDGESVAVCVSELRAIAQYCNCGNMLEVMLRDRLVCGINDQQIQKKLLAEKVLKQWR